MKILFDTNIILDLLLDRHPFSAEAIQLVQNKAKIPVYTPKQLLPLIATLPVG